MRINQVFGWSKKSRKVTKECIFGVFLLYCFSFHWNLGSNSTNENAMNEKKKKIQNVLKIIKIPKYQNSIGCVFVLNRTRKKLQ